MRGDKQRKTDRVRAALLDILREEDDWVTGKELAYRLDKRNIRVTYVQVGLILRNPVEEGVVLREYFRNRVAYRASFTHA
jgi:Fe2+ or Zn2+ uptake regulation protein